MCVDVTLESDTIVRDLITRVVIRGEQRIESRLLEFIFLISDKVRDKPLSE